MVVAEILGVLQGLDKYLSWRILCPSFFLTSGILILEKILSLSIILDIMNETARMIIGWVWVLSVLGISYKFLVVIFERRIQCILEERRQRQEDETLKRAKDKELSELVNTLSPKEKELLRYMIENPAGATWLPVEDATALSMYSQKCIYPIWNGSSLRGNYEEGSAQCFLYVLSGELKSKAAIVRDQMKEVKVSECYEKYNREA